MKYAHQYLVTTVSLFAISAMLTVPVPAGAGEIHGNQTGQNVSLGAGSFASNTSGKHNTALGHRALRLNTTGKKNTALGRIALRHNGTGSNNTAVGSEALWKNTRGNHNTALGVQALNKNTTGNKNTAVGSQALNANIMTNANTAIGYAALSKSPGNGNTAVGSGAMTNGGANGNTAVGTNALASDPGPQNVAVGYGALEKNRDSWSRGNTAVGAHALQYGIRGKDNTAVGLQAMSKTTGNNNTAVGKGALYENTTGTHNVAIGWHAAYRSINGRGNTSLGYNAGASSTTGSHNVYIGYQAGHNTTYANRSNKLVIANGNTLNDELISGDFQEHVVDINGQLNVQGQLTTVSMNIDGLLNAQSVAMTSDARLKKDIKPLTHALDGILQLQAKTYRWKEDTTFANEADIGLVAQEVEKVFPELVVENEQGYKGIAYSKLTAVLIEAIKEQQGQMTTQQDQIASLEKENTQLKTIMAEQMDALLARVAMLEGESLAAN